eukprot:TRINITY_DN7478_c0_g1_i2.p1 TRINITY_DN7478_c0_g1~~TRINITY_DN7478_c0_g1_i2.p1  ORF type:complete len:268 (-),score=69.96 TRINITY_DN7478_c0_g1_i2:50-808(-)
MLEVLGVDYTVALASFFLWTALYNLAPILCGLLLRSVPEYAAASPAGKMTVQVSLVSTTHALVVVQGALRALQDPALAADHVWGQSALAEFYCKVAIGYFVWDTSICILNFKDYGVGFLVHGVGCFFCYLFTVAQGEGFILFHACVFLLWELSTPFLNLRSVLAVLNKKDSTLYLVNGVIFTFLFFAVRIVFGFYYSVDTWQGLLSDTRVHVAFVVYYLSINVVLNALNVFWFSKIFQGIIKIFANDKGKKA